jgi:hypothetical protein
LYVIVHPSGDYIMLRPFQSIALVAQIVRAWSPESWQPKDYYNNNNWSTVYEVTVPQIASSTVVPRIATISTPSPMAFLTKFTNDFGPFPSLDQEVGRPTGIPMPFGTDERFSRSISEPPRMETTATASAQIFYQTVRVTFSAFRECLACAAHETSTHRIGQQTPTASTRTLHDKQSCATTAWPSAKATFCASMDDDSSGGPSKVIPETSAPVSSFSRLGHAPATTPSNCSVPITPLANHLQVGDSLLGSLCQPSLPRWLDDAEGRPYPSAPWGKRTPLNADATVDSDIPQTGVIRRYDFTVSRGQIWADGVKRDAIVVNNQFPGPTIEANWGDEIEVTVHNNITGPVEGTAMHWHGFLQRGSNWMDGVPSVSQCPIAPASSFAYRFTAQLYGTSFYHAHYSAQNTAGVAGPIIVHGPSQLPYDIDLGPVMLTDWFHVPYFSIVKDVVGTNLTKPPPRSDSLLINGRGRFDCADSSYSSASEWIGNNLASNQTWECVGGAELSKFQFRSGKVHRLRLINHGADGKTSFVIVSWTTLTSRRDPTILHRWT